MAKFKTEVLKYKFLLFLLLPFFVFAQNKDDNYAYSVIEKLSSEAFAGRGFVEDGMNKTADFIAEEFKKFGLDKIGDSYFQEFSMPINIIENAQLKLNGKELKYGEDFLVDPASKTQYFHPQKIYHFNPKDFENALKDKNSLVDFLQWDMLQQKEKHIVFPPHSFEVDSLNQYYKHWPHFYRPEENKNRAVIYFSSEKLIASLSQKQDSMTRFFVRDEFYTKDLNIDNYIVEAK